MSGFFGTRSFCRLVVSKFQLHSILMMLPLPALIMLSYSVSVMFLFCISNVPLFF